MPGREIRFAAVRAPREQLLLYGRSLDEAVPADSPVREYAGLLNEVDWKPWEKAYTGHGQPPIHPRYLAGAILWGLMNRIVSTRDLETAACLRVDFMWLLEGFAPDHSTFAEFRKRHGEAIGEFHREIAGLLVARRTKPLLELLIDGTRMRADSDRHGSRGAVTIELILAEIERRMKELGDEHRPEPPQEGYWEEIERAEPNQKDLVELAREIERLKKKRSKYKKALMVARKRDARARRHNGNKAKPVRVPVTDPDAHLAPNKEGGFAPNYTPVAAVESETGAIVHADVVEGSDESSAVIPAVEQGQALCGEDVSKVVADGSFATGPVLEALDSEGIDAYMPTRSASPPDNPALREDPTAPVAEHERQRLPKQGKTYARTAFVYDADTDTYRCPMGHVLNVYKRGKNKDGAQCTYYKCQACPNCPVAGECLNGKAKFRSITRDEHEPLREETNQRMATPEGRAIYRNRAPGIETVFGIIKSCMGIRRFSRRGLDNVRTDWTWICAAYNLKKLLAYLAAESTGDPSKAHYARIRFFRLARLVLDRVLRHWISVSTRPIRAATSQSKRLMVCS